MVNGHQAPALAVVVDPPPLSIVFATTPATCGGVCDGASTATVSGGAAGFACRWDDGRTSPSASGPCAADWSLIVIDADGCPRVRSTSVTEPAPLTLFVSTQATTAHVGGLRGGASAVTLSDATGCTPTRSGTSVATPVGETVAVPVHDRPVALALAGLGAATRRRTGFLGRDGHRPR